MELSASVGAIDGAAAAADVGSAAVRTQTKDRRYIRFKIIYNTFTIIIIKFTSYLFDLVHIYPF